MEFIHSLKKKADGKRLYLLVFLLILFLSISFSNISVYHRLGLANYLISTFGSMTVLGMIIYLHINYSITQLLRKKRYSLFVLLSIGLLILQFLLSSLVGYIIRLNSLEMPFLSAFSHPSIPFFRWEKVYALPLAFSSLFILFISYLLYIAFEWVDQKLTIQNLHIEKQQAENKFLKNQLNPHFLFNTLNNLQGLVLTDNQRASQALIRLSDFLKYMVYESDAPLIQLQKEIELIKDYLELERLRLDNTKTIDLQIQVNTPRNQIAPLLFLPIIENGVKHGLNAFATEAYLFVNISQQEETITLKATNSFNRSIPAHPGIGLTNLKRRLEMQYPGQYEWDTEQTESTYTTTLKILLNEA